MLFIDFEVLKHDWLCVIADTDKQTFTEIINDTEHLREYYEQNKKDIFCGYNIRNYDSYIFKSLLLDFDPYDVSQFIIEQKQKGWQYSGAFRKIKLNTFDIMTSFHSLKQLEGFMGHEIKESDIPFDIDRKLTESEIKEVLKYCHHDVEETIEVFLQRKQEFESHIGLVKLFDLPLGYIEKTKPQLSAIILGASRQSRKDEWELTIPDTLKLNKYSAVRDWYINTENRDYDKTLSYDVSGVSLDFAWGGLHGAKTNYISEGYFISCDVASLYPAIMIEYGFLSRNVADPTKYREIRDLRLQYKKVKDPRQAPLKIVLNGTYGAMKDRYNALYDPLMANNVCVAGQLLLLDLIEKLEPYGELVQTNTDGIIFRIDGEDTAKKMKVVAAEWEKRIRLDLEWETFTHIWQKDVNNYISLDKETGKIKTKGLYVKELDSLDNDLPIVNEAIINFFVHGISVKETIDSCDELIKFQKIVKVSEKYTYAMYGDTRLKEKVNRVFASRGKNDCGIVKMKEKKGELRPEKIANTPDKCRIVNSDIQTETCPIWLDKLWYIDTARKRINDFIGV